MNLHHTARRLASALGQCSASVPRLVVLSLAALVIPLGACSTDTHTFYSTHTAPKSVDVRYVQSGETAWSMDIPEGHELTLNFDRPGEGTFSNMPNTPPDVMEWKLKRVSSGTDDRGQPVDDKQNDSGKVELNGLQVQMDVTLRNRGARAGSGRTFE